MSVKFPKFLHKKPKVLGMEIVDLFMIAFSVLFIMSMEGHFLFGIGLGGGLISIKKFLLKEDGVAERLFLIFSIKRIDWNDELNRLRRKE